jgi:hypothetical protein
MIVNENNTKSLMELVELVSTDKFPFTQGLVRVCSTTELRLDVMRRNTNQGSVQVDVKIPLESGSAYTVFLDAEDLFDDTCNSKYTKGIMVQIYDSTLSVDLCGNEGLSLGPEFHPGKLADLESIVFQLSTTEDDIPQYSEFEKQVQMMVEVLERTGYNFISIQKNTKSDVPDITEAKDGITSFYKSE